MRRHHQQAEQSVAQQVSSLAEGSVLDDGSRMIVVSWMVEVAEEFGLQQETLHAAVNLLDRFLSTSNVSGEGGGVVLCSFLGGGQHQTLHAAVNWLDGFASTSNVSAAQQLQHWAHIVRRSSCVRTTAMSAPHSKRRHSSRAVSCVQHGLYIGSPQKNARAAQQAAQQLQHCAHSPAQPAQQQQHTTLRAAWAVYQQPPNCARSIVSAAAAQHAAHSTAHCEQHSKCSSSRTACEAAAHHSACSTASASATALCA